MSVVEAKDLVTGVVASVEKGQQIQLADLFAGAGGLSWGLVEALKEVAINADEPTEDVLEELIDLVAINHWETAIRTHERNHPWARHYHDDVQNVNPAEVFPDQGDIHILSGGIECTHWSSARGGKPVDEQKRMPAWHFLTWVQKLRPKNVLIENVPEFESWGPLDEDGKPTRDGSLFKNWIDSLCSHGYSVEWGVLNCANHGDATSRERLFIHAKREEDGRASLPKPTHSDDPGDDKEPWRTAAEIIDWRDRGSSIWSRDLEDGRYSPLANSTMQRIAEGLRRYCAPSLETYADILDKIGRPCDVDDPESPATVTLDDLRENALTLDEAQKLVKYVDEDCLDPFLVELDGSRVPWLAGRSPYLAKFYGTSSARPIQEPVDTITGGGLKFGLCSPETPYILGQQSGAIPRNIHTDPVNTISAGGAISFVQPDSYILPRNGRQGGLHSNAPYHPADKPLHVVTANNHDGHLISPYLTPFYGERTGQTPRTHSLTNPLPTVPATKTPVGLTTPFLTQYNGNSGAQSLTEPLPTATTKDRFALIAPELWPWGLDIKFRMLQPRELAAAMGFPEKYEFVGTKQKTVKQIGNAVPVNTAKALAKNALEIGEPTLHSATTEEVEE